MRRIKTAAEETDRETPHIGWQSGRGGRGHLAAAGSKPRSDPRLEDGCEAAGQRVKTGQGVRRGGDPTRVSAALSLMPGSARCHEPGI